MPERDKTPEPKRDYVDRLKDERDALADALGRKHAEVERLRDEKALVETQLVSALGGVKHWKAEVERLRTDARTLEAMYEREHERAEGLLEALVLIRDTDPVDAILDPDRARRVAVESLRRLRNEH